MTVIATLLLGLSPAMAQDCNPSYCVSELTAVMAVSPSISAESPPGSELDDSAFAHIGLRTEVFAKAKRAFEKAWNKGETKKTVYTIIDYSQASNEKRLWVIDMATGDVLFHDYVAHGKNSGWLRGDKMSNVNDSKTSNVGLLRTAETYYGRHGYSLKLDGLESGFNDKARSRYIVIHASNYVTEAYIQANGRAGRSWGCPAVDPAISKALINKIKGGSLVFGYANDSKWLSDSEYIKDQ